MLSAAASCYKATLSVTTGLSAPFNNLAIIYKQQVGVGVSSLSNPHFFFVHCWCWLYLVSFFLFFFFYRVILQMLYLVTMKLSVLILWLLMHLSTGGIHIRRAEEWMKPFKITCEQLILSQPWLKLMQIWLQLTRTGMWYLNGVIFSSVEFYLCQYVELSSFCSGHVEAAIKSYKQALALRPDFPEATCNLLHTLQV